jgi:hypothetical protein
LIEVVKMAFLDWIKSATFQHWVTTVIGLLAGGIEIIYPILKDGRMPTDAEWLTAAGAVLFGISTKFHKAE